MSWSVGCLRPSMMRCRVGSPTPKLSARLLTAIKENYAGEDGPHFSHASDMCTGNNFREGGHPEKKGETQTNNYQTFKGVTCPLSLR